MSPRVRITAVSSLASIENSVEVRSPALRLVFDNVPIIDGVVSPHEEAELATKHTAMSKLPTSVETMTAAEMLSWFNKGIEQDAADRKAAGRR